MVGLVLDFVATTERNMSIAFLFLQSLRRSREKMAVFCCLHTFALGPLLLLLLGAR